MAAVTGITSGRVRERRSLTMLRMPAVLRLTSSIGSAVLCGIVVGGIGGRIVMRVSALAADESRIGMLTENGNVVGRITVEGTMALLLFVRAHRRLSVGLFLFALRTVLPGRSCRRRSPPCCSRSAVPSRSIRGTSTSWSSGTAP